jgi:hypothetical protein
MVYAEAYELMNDSNDFESLLQYLTIENGAFVLKID